jgi:hypothetical protein
MAGESAGCESAADPRLRRAIHPGELDLKDDNAILGDTAAHESVWARDMPTSTANVCSLGHFGSLVSALSGPLLSLSGLRLGAN